MLTDHEARPGAGGFQPPEDHDIIGDLWTGSLVEMDDSIDWSCCPEFDSLSSAPSPLDPSIRAASAMLRAAQFDDDGVLDEWLASMAPDQFELVFDCLARMQDDSPISLEPTA